MSKRNLETEAAQVMQSICDLIDNLVFADRRLYERLEKEFQKVIAKANLGLDTPPTLAQPYGGWSLAASDLVRHIQEVWACNEGVKTMPDEEIRKLFSATEKFRGTVNGETSTNRQNVK